MAVIVAVRVEVGVRVGLWVVAGVRVAVGDPVEVKLAMGVRVAVPVAGPEVGEGVAVAEELFDGDEKFGEQLIKVPARRKADRTVIRSGVVIQDIPAT